MNKPTGLFDRNNKEINEGDWVSLDGNITSGNSAIGVPSGWLFEETDVYQVYFDTTISNWALKLGVEPDTLYNVTYMNHATSLLHSGDTTIVEPPL